MLMRICMYMYMNFRKRSIFIIHINVVLCIVFLEVMRLCPSEGRASIFLRTRPRWYGCRHWGATL